MNILYILCNIFKAIIGIIIINQIGLLLTKSILRLLGEDV